MKKTIGILTLTFSMLAFNSTAQKALIYQEGGMYGLKTDFDKELLPADCDTIFKIETPTVDFYVADEDGASSMYSYITEKRAIFNETAEENFTEIKIEKTADGRSSYIVGIDKFGNKKKHQDEGGWVSIKRSKSALAPGKNSEGLYALCDAEEALTPYQFKRINDSHKDMFLALTDTGWVVYNTKVEIAYPYAVDDLYESKKHPSAYVVKRGDKNGIFSTDNTFFVPLIKFKNPVKNLKLSTTSDADLTVGFAAQKGGKWGIIDANNKIILPFEYDDAFAFKPYDIELHQWPFVAVVKQGSDWMFLNKKYKEYKKVQFDQWISTFGEAGLVLKGGKVYSMDLKSFETSTKFHLDADEKVMVVKSDNGEVGVIDENGAIVMPFEFEIITMDHSASHGVYFVATKNGKDGIYDVSGKNLVPHKYTRLVQIASADKEYFEVGKGDAVALAYWDTEKHTINILTDYIFEYLTFESSTEGKPLAKGTKLDGSVVKVYRDGKIE